MQRRMFAHNLFLRVPGQEFLRTTGNSMALTRHLVRGTRLLAPWFLVASLGMLMMTTGLWGILFLPIFVLGYFQFSLHSVKNGGPVLATVIAAGGILLLATPESPMWASRFLASFGLALWCNRFGWWFAEWSLSKNPRLNQLFQNQQDPVHSSNDPEHSQAQDAEVIEITDA